MRLLGWIPRGADPALPPAADIPSPQRSGAGPHLPARVLAEVPVESDGTLYASIPAGTAFRLQYLDARGMAVGTQHNRWFDIQGGQSLRQGVFASCIDARCAACHGARSGLAEESFLPVDVTARASRSLARFEGDDPDRPREPFRVEAIAPCSVERRRRPPRWRAPARSARLPRRDHARRGPRPRHARTARYDVAYEALIARGEGSLHGYRYVDVEGTSARGSYLVERVLGVELDAPRAVPGAAVHRGEPSARRRRAAHPRALDRSGRRVARRGGRTVRLPFTLAIVSLALGACSEAAPAPADATVDATPYELTIAAPAPDGFSPLASDAGIEMRLGFQGFRYTRVVLIATGGAPATTPGRVRFDVEGFDPSEQRVNAVTFRANGRGSS